MEMGGSSGGDIVVSALSVVVDLITTTTVTILLLVTVTFPCTYKPIFHNPHSICDVYILHLTLNLHRSTSNLILDIYLTHV